MSHRVKFTRYTYDWELRSGLELTRLLESRVQSSEFRNQSPESRVQSPEFRNQSLEFRVQKSEFRVQSSEIRVQSSEFTRVRYETLEFPVSFGESTIQSRSSVPLIGSPI